MKVFSSWCSAGLILLALSSVGCYMDPAHEMRLLLQSEAGQKLVDKMQMSGEVKNPQMGFRLYTGGEVYFTGVEGGATIAGEVSPEERGFAPRTTATRPATN